MRLQNITDNLSYFDMALPECSELIFLKAVGHTVPSTHSAACECCMLLNIWLCAVRGCRRTATELSRLPPRESGTVCQITSRLHSHCLFSAVVWRLISSAAVFVNYIVVPAKWHSSLWTLQSLFLLTYLLDWLIDWARFNVPPITL